MLLLRQSLQFTPARAQKTWRADRMNDQRRFDEGKDAYQSKHERMSLYRVKELATLSLSPSPLQICFYILQ